jgi:hypothetical protein
MGRGKSLRALPKMGKEVFGGNARNYFTKTTNES